MPRFGSYALVISRRNHLDLEKLGKATPRLLSGLNQAQAGDFVLLIRSVRIRDEAISNDVHVVHEPRPNNRHSPLHAVMKPASYPFMDEATQRHHSTDKGVPRCVLLGIGIWLDPQAVTYQGDSTLEQLSSPGLGLEEVLERGGRRLGRMLLLLEL
jgi:hypothetical protein